MARIVELAHKLEPGRQRFKLNVREYSVHSVIPQYHVAEGEWYIMEDLETCTHVGTHVEVPYHAIKDGTQIADMHLRTFLGPAAVLDFTDKGHNQAIVASELQSRGSHVRKGDIILLCTGLSRHYGTERYKRPYLEDDCLDWLFDQGIKCLGVDCSGIENRNIQSHEKLHRRLFQHDVPLIEDMNNLVELREDRFFFLSQPLPVEGLDASPIRPIAIESENSQASETELARVFLSADTEWVGLT
jgi:arylformamidase